jgi:hypothetical protein
MIPTTRVYPVHGLLIEGHDSLTPIAGVRGTTHGPVATVSFTMGPGQASAFDAFFQRQEEKRVAAVNEGKIASVEGWVSFRVPGDDGVLVATSDASGTLRLAERMHDGTWWDAGHGPWTAAEGFADPDLPRDSASWIDARTGRALRAGLAVWRARGGRVTPAWCAAWVARVAEVSMPTWRAGSSCVRSPTGAATSPRRARGCC